MKSAVNARLFRRSRRVVYTCLFGYSEALNAFPREPDDRIDHICFTDDPDLRSDVWRVVCMPRTLLDPVREAKRIKIRAHRFLADYDESLYIDNTVRLKKPARVLFEQYIDRSAAPLAMFRHPWRGCVYDEAQAVIDAGFDTADNVNAQMAFYRSAGHPVAAGLYTAAFLLRRHHDPSLVALMETWFEQVVRYSYRDQLSFPVAVRLHGFRPMIIDSGFLANDILEWPVVHGERLPRDFDDLRYLGLHPDVKEAGINPRRHFMETGRAEGRSYK